jgi:hypothetical protein
MKDIPDLSEVLLQCPVNRKLLAKNALKKKKKSLPELSMVV